MPVVSVGFPPNVQLTLSLPQFRIKFELGAKPAPLTIIPLPTIPEEGEMVIDDDDAADALTEDGATRRNVKQKSARAAVTAILLTSLIHSFTLMVFSRGSQQSHRLLELL